jgi:hypothetical protein
VRFQEERDYILALLSTKEDEYSDALRQRLESGALRLSRGMTVMDKLFQGVFVLLCLGVVGFIVAAGVGVGKNILETIWR